MNLKRFLPFDDFVLTTRISPEEVFERINNIHEPKQSRLWDWSLFGDNIVPYEGCAWNDGFVINRVVGKNSMYMPEVTGRFSASNGITTINVWVRSSTMGMIAVVLLLSVTGLMSLFVVLGMVHQIMASTFSSHSLLLFIPLVMFTGIYWFAISSYKLEVRYSCWFLCELLEANEM